MRNLWQLLAVAVVGISLGVAVVGCGASPATNTDNMAGDKMTTGKMTDNTTGGDKMAGDKMTTGKMTDNMMGGGKMAGNKMGSDKKIEGNKGGM